MNESCFVFSVVLKAFCQNVGCFDAFCFFMSSFFLIFQPFIKLHHSHLKLSVFLLSLVHLTVTIVSQKKTQFCVTKTRHNKYSQLTKMFLKSIPLSSSGKFSKPTQAQQKEANPCDASRADLNSAIARVMPKTSIKAGNGPSPGYIKKKKNFYFVCL